MEGSTLGTCNVQWIGSEKTTADTLIRPLAGTMYSLCGLFYYFPTGGVLGGGWSLLCVRLTILINNG